MRGETGPPVKLLVGLRGNVCSTRHLLEETEGRIHEIYLSVLNARLGSGRAYVHEVGFDELDELVPLAASHGVDVVVVRNVACTGGRECLPAFQAEFRDYVRRVRAAGVRKLVLAHPLHMRQALEACPDLEVGASLYAEVDTLDRLKYFEDLGVRRITLPPELNRDLRRLEQFAAHASSELSVLLNLACVHHCARAGRHCRYVGHGTSDLGGRAGEDCYLAWCDGFRINRPWELLAANWIRPEDLHRYESIGIHHFKLAGRATAVSWIIRAARAYADRRYDGNLADLLSQCYPYTDRCNERGPFHLPNAELGPWMDRLFSCGHECENCDWCRSLYERLGRHSAAGVS